MNNKLLENKNSVKVNIFNLNSFFKLDRKIWVVSKHNPNVPLMKLNESDFDLVCSQVFKKQDNKVTFNGKTYYISNEMVNNVNVQLKLNKININDISFSMQEFLNEELIVQNQPKIEIPYVFHTIKTNLNNKICFIADETYIAESYNNFIVEKLTDRLEKEGVEVSEIFYLKDSFFEDYNSDDIIMKKCIVLLGEVTNLKIIDNQFKIIENTNQHNLVTVYDSLETINEYKKNLNLVYEYLYNNSKDNVKQVLDSKFSNDESFVTLCIDNLNSFNKTFKTEVFQIKKPRMIKTFESFKFGKSWN